jgi:murein tripeptide amidase MpaA
MKFLIHELIHNSDKYDYLLTNYVVRLVPMVNPDGTTIGNSRCSLVGLDLNRRWAEPNPVIHSEIYFLKH